MPSYVPDRDRAGRRLLTARLGAVALMAALIVALCATPAVASAQFVSGLTPPVPRPSAEEVAAAESVTVARRDSVAREQRLDMRAWVDSAAASLEKGDSPSVPVPSVPGSVPSDTVARDTIPTDTLRPNPPLPTPPRVRPIPSPPPGNTSSFDDAPGLAAIALVAFGSRAVLHRRRR